MPWGERMMSALFESVTARTAGFTTLPLSRRQRHRIRPAVADDVDVHRCQPGRHRWWDQDHHGGRLMAATRSTLRGQDDVVIRHRQIRDKVVLRAVSITMASLMFVLVMAMLLSLASNQNVEGTSHLSGDAVHLHLRLRDCGPGSGGHR